MTTASLSHVGILIIIIIAAGILGGLANYFLDRSERNWVAYDVLKSALLGMVASATVPLFLKIVSSSIMKDAEADALQYFVFCGFCLIAAAFSNRYLQGLGDRILQELKEVKRENAELKETTAEMKQDNETLKDAAGAILLSGSDDADEATEGGGVAPVETPEAQFESFRGVVEESTPRSVAPSDPKTLLRQQFKDARHKFRTIQGLCKATRLDENTVHTIVSEWEKEGKLKKIKRPDGVTVWMMV